MICLRTHNSPVRRFVVSFTVSSPNIFISLCSWRQSYMIGTILRPQNFTLWSKYCFGPRTLLRGDKISSECNFCLCLFMEAMQGFHAHPMDWLPSGWPLSPAWRLTPPPRPELSGLLSPPSQHFLAVLWTLNTVLAWGFAQRRPSLWEALPHSPACSPIISKCHILFLVRLSQMTPYKTAALIAYLESCRLSLLHLHIHTFCFASVYLFLACIPHFRPWAPFSTDSAP